MNINAIYDAKARLRSYLRTTPLLKSHLPERKLNKQVGLKLHLQYKIIGILPKANPDTFRASAPGEKSFAIIKEYVDDVRLAEENEISSRTK